MKGECFIAISAVANMLLSPNSERKTTPNDSVNGRKMAASFGGNLMENGSRGPVRTGELEAIVFNGDDAGPVTVATDEGDNEVRVTTYATQANVTDNVIRDTA